MTNFRPIRLTQTLSEYEITKLWIGYKIYKFGHNLVVWAKCFMVHFELKIMVGTQNQHSTTYLCHNCNYAQISKSSMEITDKLVKSWFAWHLLVKPWGVGRDTKTHPMVAAFQQWYEQCQRQNRVYKVRCVQTEAGLQGRRPPPVAVPSSRHTVNLSRENKKCPGINT